MPPNTSKRVLRRKVVVVQRNVTCGQSERYSLDSDNIFAQGDYAGFNTGNREKLSYSQVEGEQIGNLPIVSADIHADRVADINRFKFSISAYLQIEVLSADRLPIC